MKKINKNRRGFTLLELLVVVLIIAVLAAIALPQYYYVINVTKVKANMNTVKAIADASDRYALANGAYPSFNGSYATSNTTINRVLDIDVPDLQYMFFSKAIVIWDLKTDMRIGYSIQEYQDIPAKKFFCYYQTWGEGLPLSTKEKICKKICNVNEIQSSFPSGSHAGCVVN